MRQGNRTSKLREQFGEKCVVPSGVLDLSAQRALRSFFLHCVQRHVAQDRQIFGTVTETGAVLILVHDDVEAPMQAVLHAPMFARNLVQAFGRQCRADVTGANSRARTCTQEYAAAAKLNRKNHLRAHRKDPDWEAAVPAREFAPVTKEILTQLTGFEGVLQVDGYAAYASLAGDKKTSGKIRLAFCLVHARRNFVK